MVVTAIAASLTALNDVFIQYPMSISIPAHSFLDECELLGAFNGERRWRSADGRRLYTWDFLHGEIEVFNARGWHLGAADALTGVLFKPARKGRRINV